MPRIFVTLFMVLAVAVTVSKFYSAAGVDRTVVASIENAENFIVLQGDKDSAMLAQRRQECGDLRSQIGVDPDGDQMEHLISEGKIPRRCLVFVANSKRLETGRSVILSITGDIVIDYERSTSVPWSEANSFGLDILEIESGSRFALKIG